MIFTPDGALQIAVELGIVPGFDEENLPFAGNYQTKGLYAYKTGKYAGHAFFGVGGSIKEMKGRPTVILAVSGLLPAACLLCFIGNLNP